MGHITTLEEDYKGNNTSRSLQFPLANSSTPNSMLAAQRRQNKDAHALVTCPFIRRPVFFF
jgi:c-di-GMP-binding flagellar brake protein YcgR